MSKAGDRLARLRRRLSPFGSISRRIAVINLIGLALLVGGALYLNQFRAGLIDMRADALETQAGLIAVTIAEAAGLEGERPVLDPTRANEVLRRLAPSTGARARLYDHRGRLIGDTRELEALRPIATDALPPPGAAPPQSALSIVERAYDSALSLIFGDPPLYRETLAAGVANDTEIYVALAGQQTRVEQANSRGDPIVSVFAPVARFKAVMGALALSSEGEDIAEIVRQERFAILRVAGGALLVSVLLSLLLASSIARPLRRLANAAGALGAAQQGERRALPDFSRRTDEIGRLSGALSRMTDALQQRIDANERFAADVAHEIKNPLSSLRSAVEVLDRARDDDARARLAGVIRHDVRRLDRLVTDISNASRLDAELGRETNEPVDLPGLLRAVMAVSEDQAAARGVTLALDAPEPVHAPGREGRLGQVARNLVENAISFTPRGGAVTLRAHTGPGWAEFVVEDDGPGLPENKLDAVFDRFWTERPAEEGFGEHSGLGLSIARQIVEAHEGTIRAENRAEGGARFTVRLPA